MINQQQQSYPLRREYSQLGYNFAEAEDLLQKTRRDDASKREQTMDGVERTVELCGS